MNLLNKNKNTIINQKYFMRIKKIIIIIVIEKFVLIDFYKKKNLYIINYSKHVQENKLIEMPKNKRDALYLNEKKELLKYISVNIGKNITSIKTLFINSNLNFGNQFILLNKAIYFCEILGCKRMILNKELFWYIKNEKLIKNIK